MAIHHIGSNKAAAMESSTDQHSTEIQNARVAYDSAHSSIMSLSKAQEDGGIGDFFYNMGSGLWSIATWPFKTVGSLFSWMIGSTSTDDVNQKDDEEKGGGKSGGGSKSGKGGGKRTEADADFVEFFRAANEDGEFELAEFKKAYKALSSEGKKSYENLLWKNGGFQPTAGSKSWAKKEIETPKKDYSKETQKLLEQAAEQYKAIPDVKRISDRYLKLAEKELKNVEDEDGDVDFKDDKKTIKKAFDKLPAPVKKEVNDCAAYYAPDPVCAVVSRKDKPKWDERKEIFAVKGKAYVMQTFAKNSFLFVSDPAAREDIETMVRVIGQAINTRDPSFGLSEANFANAYKNMTTKMAKKAYADIIGYAIGRPEDGEKYLNGKLKVDGHIIAPNVALLGRKLAQLAMHDGIRPSKSFEVFFPRVEDEEEGGGDDDLEDRGPRKKDGGERRDIPLSGKNNDGNRDNIEEDDNDVNLDEGGNEGDLGEIENNEDEDDDEFEGGGDEVHQPPQSNQGGGAAPSLKDRLSKWNKSLNNNNNQNQ